MAGIHDQRTRTAVSAAEIDSGPSGRDAASRDGDGGRVIVNPVSGERIVVRQSGRDTDGRLFAFDLFLPPGGHVPAGHAHPTQRERFTVMEGSMRFRLGRRTILATPGDSVEIPPRTSHWFGNAGPSVAHARVEVRPALRMEEFFEATEEIGRAGHIPGTRLPRVSDLARVMLEFRQEVAAPYVPALVVRAVLAPFAWFGNRRARRQAADEPGA
jgi:quercetin dioxygenase-like cupin family protein